MKLNLGVALAVVILILAFPLAVVRVLWTISGILEEKLIEAVNRSFVS